MSGDVANNKRANREFHITDKFEAGLVLKGTEVKSIREGKVNIRDAFARLDRNELWLYGCGIEMGRAQRLWYCNVAPVVVLLHVLKEVHN